MLDEDDIEKLKAKPGVGTLYCIALDDAESGESYDFVLREPRERYDHFRKMLLDQTTRDTAMKTAVTGCVVHPEGQALLDVLQRYPAFWDELGEEVHNLAGARFKKTVKKL